MANDRLARNWPSAALALFALITVTAAGKWPHLYATAGLLMLTALLVVLIDINEHLNDIAHRNDTTD